jgi:hypothetical protein
MTINTRSLELLKEIHPARQRFCTGVYALPSKYNSFPYLDNQKLLSNRSWYFFESFCSAPGPLMVRWVGYQRYVQLHCSLSAQAIAWRGKSRNGFAMLSR